MSTFANGYTYCRVLTVDSSKVTGGSDLANFPLLVSITDPALKSVANGGKVQSANGYDIRFELANGTKLDHEVATWNGTTGALVAWVRLPTLSASTGASVYLYYGKPSVTVSEQNRTGVWDSGYAGVYNFGDGTTLSLADSTANARNATAVGTPTTATSPVGGALSLANGQYAQITGLMGNPTKGTISAWVYKTSTGQGELVSLGDTFACRLDDNYGNSAFLGWHHDASNWPGTPTGTKGALDNAWHYVTFTDDPSVSMQAVYIDGARGNSNTISTAWVYNQGANTTIGHHGNGSANYNYVGQIAAVRISNVVRSTGWIATEYKNQSSPSTFYTLGSETTSGATTTTSTKTVAVSAVLTKTGRRTVSVTSVLTKAAARTVTTDAVALRHGARTVTTDAVILRHGARTLSADAVAQRTGTKTVQATAITTRTGQRTLAATAVTLRPSSKTVQVTAVTSQTSHRTLVGTAVLTATVAHTLRIDAVTLAHRTRTITITGVVGQAAGLTLQVDAMLVARRGRTLVVDAVLLDTTERTISLSGVVLTTSSRSVSGDAVLVTRGQQTLDVGAVLERAETQSFQVTGVVLRQALHRTLLLDAALSLPPNALWITVGVLPALTLKVAVVPQWDITVGTVAPFVITVTATK